MPGQGECSLPLASVWGEPGRLLPVSESPGDLLPEPGQGGEGRQQRTAGVPVWVWGDVLCVSVGPLALLHAAPALQRDQATP